MEKKAQVREEDKDLKFYFENKFLSRRIDFIQDYDFESDKKNNKYFESFIMNFELTKNDWYDSLIIEIADRLSIRSKELGNRYLSYLSSKKISDRL